MESLEQLLECIKELKLDEDFKKRLLRKKVLRLAREAKWEIDEIVAIIGSPHRCRPRPCRCRPRDEFDLFLDECRDECGYRDCLLN